MPRDTEIRRLVERACVEFEPDLRAFLSGVLRDSHLVDDAFQRTVMRALEAAADVRSATIRGWLFRIALNEARGIKRTATQQGRLHRSVWEFSSSSEQVESADGLSCAVSAEEKEWVQQALSRLPENYRDVVTRRIQDGQTFAVIAEELNKPLGTVLSWMRRALAELRAMSEIKEHGRGTSAEAEQKTQ